MKKLLCFLLCLGIVSTLAACSSPDGPPATASPSSTSSEPEESSSSSVSSAPSADTSSESSEVKENTIYDIIPGSHVTNISMGLEENFNIPRAAIQSSKDTTISKHYGNSSYTEPNTGLVLSYDYSSGDDFAIIDANFDIINSFLVSQDDFYEVAEIFLSFCATVPYDTCDIDAAKKFVTDNIRTAPPEGVATQIGDAVISMYSIQLDAGCSVVGLSVTSADFYNRSGAAPVSSSLSSAST